MSGCAGVECSSSGALFELFKEIKEDLEDLNKEIKKTANWIRGKLKCKFAFWGLVGCGCWYLTFPRMKVKTTSKLVGYEYLGLWFSCCISLWLWW